MGRALRTGPIAEAAAAENLMWNSGPKVDTDVMVEAAKEVAEVKKVEGRIVAVGDAVVITDAAGTAGDEGLAIVSDLLYEAEAVGMVGVEIEEDGSGENVQVWIGGGGMERELGVEAGGLQGEDEDAAKTVERSAYHTPQHVEAGKCIACSLRLI